MVQLQANMHAYRPDRALDWLRPALRKCADLGLLVKLHTGDGPYSIPSEWYPLIREFPSVNFIMAHFGVQTGGVYCFEPYQMALDTPNVFCESSWCLQSRIVEFAKVLPTHKILYGSDTPPNEPGMWLRLLEVLCHEPPQGLNLDEDTLEDYLGNNLARMIGLAPTARPKSVEEAQAYLKQHAGRSKKHAGEAATQEPLMIIDYAICTRPTSSTKRGRHTGEPFTGERLLKMMDGPYIINGKLRRRIDMGFIQHSARQHRLSRWQSSRPRRHSLTTYRTYRRAHAEDIRTASSATTRTTRVGARRKTALLNSNST